MKSTACLHYRNSHTVASSLVRNTTKYCPLNITINEDNPAPVGFANTNPALAGFRNLESGTALNFIASYLLYISAYMQIVYVSIVYYTLRCVVSHARMLCIERIAVKCVVQSVINELRNAAAVFRSIVHIFRSKLR